MKKVIIIPETNKNNGFGHIKRSLTNHKNIENSFLFIKKDFYEKNKKIFKDTKVIHELKKEDNILFIIDRPVLKLSNLKKYLKLGTCLGLDVRGEGRSYLDYNIDTLPNNALDEANKSGLCFLNYNIPDKNEVKKKLNSLKEKNKNKEKIKILLSFGGEDPKKIALNVYKSKLLQKYFNCKIFILKGPRCFWLQENDFTNCTILKNKSHLDRDFFKEYDLILTSMGFTYFEVLNYNIPVLIINHSKYHDFISKKIGIKSLGICNIIEKKLQDFLFDPLKIQDQYNLINKEKEKFNSFIYNFKIEQNNLNCPLCKNRINKVIHRRQENTFFLCLKCNLTYMKNFTDSFEYNQDYFFKDYKKQYGLTYLEDFFNIKNIAKTRLDIIEKYKKECNILDIGCSYGPFLQEAKERSFNCHGIEINKEASEYIKDKFDIKIFNGSFLDYENEFKIKFDIITMWFVIEHFNDLDLILYKVRKFLKKDGLFCISTPNLGGLSALKDKNNFLNNSPKDHFILLNEREANIFYYYGFVLLETKIKGIHSKRISDIYDNDITAQNILKDLKLGDTFEAYYKIKELN